MGFFNKLSRLFHRNKPILITQEEREAGGIATGYKWHLKKERLDMEHEIEMLKLERQKQRLEEQLGYIEEQMDPNDPDMMLMNIFKNILSRKTSSSNNQMPGFNGINPHNPAFDYWHSQETSTQTMPSTTISDQQLQQLWARIPSENKPMIKAASNQQIQEWALQEDPGIGPDNIQKIISFVRAQ